MFSRNICRALCLALLVAALGGCRTDYQYRTKVFPDGSVERDVLQPAEDTPAAAQKDGVWKSMEIVGEKDKPKKFKASGRFASVKDLPESLLFGVVKDQKAAELLPSSKLKPQHDKRDLVFVTEHRWTETLTDPVTLTSLREGREELTTLVIDYIEDVFKEALGKDYDATELFKWARNEGKTWLAELTDEAFTQFLAHRHAVPITVDRVPPEVVEPLADICARHGLQFRENGKLIDNANQRNQVMEDFFVNLIAAKVRRKDTGKAVDKDTVQGWYKEIDKGGDKNRFRVAAEKVATARPGGAEAFGLKVVQALVKVVGIQWLAPFSQRVFDCTLTMPGEVVETNGQLQAGNRVRWQFTGQLAWPSGYAMTCRSLEPNTQLQKDLLAGQPLDSRETMVEFLALAAPDSPLFDVLQRCRTQKSLKPLHELRQQKQEKKEDLKDVDALFKLLKVKPEGK